MNEGQDRRKNMDYIEIKNLEVFANHGVYKEETELGQKFIISAKLYFDMRPAGINDNLDKTVNYAKACGFITDYMKKNTFLLIEACAEHLSRQLLLNFEPVLRVELSIKKPWAPIGLPLEYVSVNVDRKWHEVYLSIGSNMGDRQKYLEGAVKQLESRDTIRIKQVSAFIETKPYGNIEQGDFLNGAVLITTVLTPEELLREVNAIESWANRERSVRWGPRTLDIDIVFYDDEIIKTDDLTIPHIDMHNRRFVLEPMCEINRYFVHPQLRKTMDELLNELK